LLVFLVNFLQYNVHFK